ncbi:methionine aminopeptidase 1D, mitochondrial-like [Anneissia japonica]|uniref:methionine aminopeptidase 1D, mitochondrial-like n=1 Tax=Anneissia japonica TaxID=1529436 RepID=UPI0014254BDB|nr:methionine aminopeptidase 1D, mitochondrial-like [Anneissia japonica]
MAASIVRKCLGIIRHPVVKKFLQSQSPQCRKTLRTGLHQRSLFSFFEKLKHLRSNIEDLPYSHVTPAEVSPIRNVPEHIIRPEYVRTGTIPPVSRYVNFLEKGDIPAMRDVCAIARKILNVAAAELKVGVTTDYIDEVIHETCISYNAYPSTLLYRSYPKSVCTSVNNVMCHGIPDSRPLVDGDIINVDFTAFYNGFHGDLSETYCIGNVDETGRKLVDVARRCRDEAIKKCGPLQKLNVIGNTIHKVASEAGFVVSPSFLGHGIGRLFHCQPSIYHHANMYPELMQPGMAFTIEPVIVEGIDKPYIDDDQWTVMSKYNHRSAQFEHTILITDTGLEVLTRDVNKEINIEDGENDGTIETLEVEKAQKCDSWQFK